MSVKFRNPKTNEIFEVGYSFCSDLISTHPHEAAELIGYEVVEENKSRLDLTKFAVGVGVQCKTEEEAKELLGALYSCGYKWSNGDELIAYTMWEICKEQTAYFHSKEDKKVVYGNAEHEENVIQFTNLIVREEKSVMENIKPRMCEILGIDVDEKFTVENEEGTFYISNIGQVTTGVFLMNPRVLCDIINHPEKICPIISFSEEEKAQINAIKIIYPAVKYIYKSKTDNIGVFNSNKELITAFSELKFPNLLTEKEIDITNF